MKNLFVILLVGLMVTGCNQPQAEVHQVELGLYTPYAIYPETLNGKVKSVIEKNYFAVEKDGAFEKGKPLTVEDRDSLGWSTNFELKYNEDGNLLYAADIDENGEVIQHWDVKNEDQKMVACKLMRDDTLRLVSRLSYSEAGVLTKLQHFRMPADSLVFQAIVISDENGNYTEWQILDGEGNSTGKYMFDVNQEGKRAGYKYLNKEGEQTFEQQYTFGDLGFMIRQVMINKEGEESVSEYEYPESDEMGNWTQTLGNSSKGFVIIAERTISYHAE